MELLATGGVTGEPGKLRAESIDTTELANLLRQNVTPHVQKLKKACELGKLLCGLRTSLRIALLSEQSVKSSVWNDVQQALMRANEAGIRSKEINLIKQDASLRAQVDDVMEKLNLAARSNDEGWLKLGLDQATRLNMESNSSTSVRESVMKAKETLARIETTKELLKVAISSISIPKLEDALTAASRFNYRTDLVSEADTLLEKCLALRRRADEALEGVFVDKMRSVTSDCLKLGLHLDHIDKMKFLLALPEQKLLQRQLKASVQMNDRNRVTLITVRIKEIFFAQAAGLFKFEQYPNLKPRNLFAKRYGVHNDHLKKGMLSWTNEPLHTSLTRLDDAEHKRLATRVFKNIMGYMGDRQYSYPTMLAHEVTKMGIDEPGLRDEIYCQLVKQLIDNPNPDSISRGWNLMALCLSSFPPSDEFENYLELFMRNCQQDRCVRKLHKIVFEGARQRAIGVEEIEVVQHRSSRFSIAMPSPDIM